LVIIAMDLYPEVIIAHGALRGSSWFAALLRAVFRWAYRTASRVVVLGPVMAERLVSKGVAPTRLVEIQNWSTGTPGVVRGAANRLLSEWGLQGRFVLCYSGNLGVGHEFDTLLEGFALAAHSLPELFLVIVGKGSRLAEVRAKVAALDIARNVRFEGFLPANRLPESIGLADLAVVTMRPGFEGLIVPSKLYGCMSRGVPVLYIGPRSDTEVSIQRYSCGVTVRNHDVQAVARVVAELYADRGRLESLGEAGRRWYATELDRPMALARYEAVVRSCVDSH
jgi:glycosyltransferase involved in cell wall biosynthesis